MLCSNVVRYLLFIFHPQFKTLNQLNWIYSMTSFNLHTHSYLFSPNKEDQNNLPHMVVDSYLADFSLYPWTANNTVNSLCIPMICNQKIQLHIFLCTLLKKHQRVFCRCIPIHRLSPDQNIKHLK